MTLHPDMVVASTTAAAMSGFRWLLGFALALLAIETVASGGHITFATHGGGGGIGSVAKRDASPQAPSLRAAAPSVLGAAVSLAPVAAANASSAAPVFAANTWSFVGCVTYINLRAAADRGAALRRDFLPSFAAPGGFGPPVTRFEAFEAPSDMPGIYGAALSHIGALQLALDSGCESVLVLEDDVAWRLSADGTNLRLLQRLAQQPYDVILLGATVVYYNATTSRVFYAHATSSYLVARHYLQNLIDNFAEGLHRLGRAPRDHDFFIDVFWMRAMNAPGANWFVVAPSLIVQEHYLSEYVGFSARDMLTSGRK